MNLNHNGGIELSLKKWEYEKEKLARDITNLMGQKFELFGQVKLLNHALAQNRDAQNRLQKSLANIDGEIENRKKSVTIQEEDLKRQQEQLSREKAEFGSIREAVLAKVKDIRLREPKLQALEKEFAAREKLIADREARVQGKEKFLQISEENIFKTLSQLKDDRKALAAERQLFQRKQNDVEQTEAKFKQRWEQLSKKEAELMESESRLRSAETEARENLAQLNSQAEQLSKDIAQLESKKGSTKKDLDQFEARQQKKNGIIREIEAKVQDKARELDRLSEEIMLKRKELKRPDAATAPDEDQARKRIELLKQQEADVTAELGRMEQQLSRTKRESALASSAEAKAVGAGTDAEKQELQKKYSDALRNIEELEAKLRQKESIAAAAAAPAAPAMPAAQKGTELEIMQELKIKEEEVKRLEDTNIHLIQQVEEMERKLAQADIGAPAGAGASESSDLPQDVKRVLEIADKLLQKLPEDVIQEFTQSADFELFESIFKKYNLG